MTFTIQDIIVSYNGKASTIQFRAAGNGGTVDGYVTSLS